MSRSAMAKYIIAESAAGRPIQAKAHARGCMCGCTSESDRRSICSALGWDWTTYYQTWRSLRRRPYVYEQEDADDGLVSPDLVGLPAVFVGPTPANHWTFRVATTVEEVFDYTLESLQGTKTHIDLHGTGVTEPTLTTLAGTAGEDVRDAAEHIHGLVTALRAAMDSFVHHVERAKRRAADARQLEELRERLIAEAARLGVDPDL